MPAIENDFGIIFGYEPTANVYTPNAFSALSTIANGNVSGIADSKSGNYLWRQSSTIGALISQFTIDKTGQTFIDSGSVNTNLSNFTSAILASHYAADTSTSVNAMNVTMSPALVNIPVGTALTLKPNITNTSACTLTVNGIGPTAIHTPSGALSGGELVSGNTYGLIYNGTYWIMNDYDSPETLASVTGRGNTTSTAVSITNTTTASSTSTGALIVQGGISTLDNIYAGGEISVPYITTGGVITKSTGIVLGNTNPTGVASTVSTTIPTFTIKACTYTDNTTTGTLATIITSSNIVASTFASTNTGVTYTTASTFYISGAPNAGTNVTITNPYALYINSGNSYFNGNITSTGSISCTGETDTGSLSANTLSVTTTSTFTGIATFTAAPVFSTSITIPASSVASTPSWNDNTTKVATTAYVQANEGNFAQVIPLSVTTSLTSGQMGSLIVYTGSTSGLTCTVSTPVGFTSKIYSFLNTCTNPITISTPSGVIQGIGLYTAAANTYVIPSNTAIEIVSDGVNYNITSNSNSVFTTPISLPKPGAAITASTYTVLSTDSTLIFNTTATCTVTLPAGSSYPGRILHMKNIAAFAINSAGSNVYPITSSTAGTAIMTSAQHFAMLQSDGLNWVTLMVG